MVDSQILAMGGGGFSMEPDNPLLDDYLLSLLATDRKPRVCFVPAASGDSDGYSGRFMDAFGPDRAEATVLSLFSRTVDDLHAFLLNQDVVYVGGGSTADLLAIWRVHGLDVALEKAYRAGVILAGVSVGMNCWFEASVTDSFDANGVGLHFTDGQLTDVVTSRPGANAYRVTRGDLEVSEQRLPARYLGAG